MDSADDNRLILKQAVYQQDREALALLYDKYYAHVKHYIARRIDSNENAEDLAQDVFVELCKNKDHYDGRGDVKWYLFGIARNMIRRYHRRKRRLPRIISIDRISEFGLDCVIRQPLNQAGQILSQNLKKLIEDSKSQLPPKAYEAIKLRYINGLCPKEAAYKTECSIKAFYARLERAMKRLRKIQRQRGQRQIRDVPALYAGVKD